MLSRSLRTITKSSFLRVIPKAVAARSLVQSPAVKNSTPWYLNPEESSLSSSPLAQIELPKLPNDHPETLENLVVYLANELGICDMKVFDMRNKINGEMVEGAYDISDFMIIGTGKSTKHLQKASSELDFYIKHNLHKLPSTEGILKSGQLAKYHRRLQKKGKTAPKYSKHDYGSSPNTWVMTDTKTEGIIIHMLTKERRRDLNLEYLWAEPGEKHLYKRSARSFQSDDIFSGIRYFHTSRVVKFDQFDLTKENYANQFNVLLQNHLVDASATPLLALQKHIDLMYAAGLNMDFDMLYAYFKTIIESKEFDKDIDDFVTVFTRREKFLHRLVQNYNIELTKNQILKLTPLLIVSGSQFNVPAFVTMKKVVESSATTYEGIFTYSKTINQLELLSNKITNSVVEEQRALKRNIDLLLLTVYANRSNWVHFFRVLKYALKRNDQQVLQASLILVSASDDLKIISKFEQEILPLIVSAEIPEELKNYAEKVYNKANNL